MNAELEPKFKISTILKFLEKREGVRMDDMRRKSLAYELAKIEKEAED